MHLFASLRTRLSLLVLLALLPALGLILYQADEQRRDARQDAEEDVLAVAQQMSAAQQNAIADSRLVLSTLASLLTVIGRPFHELPTESCGSFLEGVRLKDSIYLNIGIIATDGVLVCSAIAGEESPNLSDRAYFQEALATRDFSVGTFQVGGVTGKASINTALPVISASGEILGIVHTALDLEAISLMAAGAGLPEGAAMTVVDRSGTIVMRHPDPGDWIGVTPETEFISRALSVTSPQTAQVPGLDDVDRIFGFTPLFETGGQESPVVAVGVPVATAFANLNAVLTRSLISLAVVSVMIFAVTWVAGDVVVMRRIRGLLNATRRLASGDLHARSGISRRDGELGQLAGAFDDMAESLQRRQEELTNLNADLEQRVEERTAQLEAANGELEAFSYSVSHDLRAPLRAIAGFSQIVTEDYADKLDDEGRRYLQVIQNSTYKMGELIDDLLAFSRAGRQELVVSRVDVGTVARAAFDELREQINGRTIDFQLRDVPAAMGDMPLLRQVFANLLSNSVKYTRPRAAAEIEVGGMTGEGESIYFVRDNGVGFDMEYVGKLFGVFQRLHSADEFEGTGVGLALVQRIIHRHGGRVWAEGKVGDGATFWFTLPTAQEKV